jgi:type VI secretion system protein ImpA
MPTNLAPLAEPVSPESPCGADLEDTQLLASFDAFRIFGNATPLSPETDWQAIRQHALTALEQSRDLRILTHLAAALLRIDGVVAFCGVLALADQWLAERWELVFPRVEDDALSRQNALSCLADPMAIVAPLRRCVVITHRQLGTVTLRDIERVTGAAAAVTSPAGTGQPDSTVTDVGIPDSAQVEAALQVTPVAELATLVATLSTGTNSLDNMVANMQQHAGPQAAPDFAPLAKPLMRMRKVLAEHLATRAKTNSPTPASGVSTAAGAAPAHMVEAAGLSVGTDSGEIQSRDQAIRAIDAAMLYFRKHEPSSPVPMLLERARRLVAKGFLEVLEDIAPDGLPQARIIGGVRNTAE